MILRREPLTVVAVAGWVASIFLPPDHHHHHQHHQHHLLSLATALPHNAKLVRAVVLREYAVLMPAVRCPVVNRPSSDAISFMPARGCCQKEAVSPRRHCPRVQGRLYYPHQSQHLPIRPSGVHPPPGRDRTSSEESLALQTRTGLTQVSPWPVPLPLRSLTCLRHQTPQKASSRARGQKAGHSLLTWLRCERSRESILPARCPRAKLSKTRNLLHPPPSLKQQLPPSRRDLTCSLRTTSFNTRSLVGHSLFLKPGLLSRLPPARSSRAHPLPPSQAQILI